MDVGGKHKKIDERIYLLMKHTTTISILYIYYNTPKELLDSIASLQSAISKVSYEVIIINNNSPMKIPSSIQKDKKYTIINSEKNLGYGGGINRGVAVANGEYILVANPDVIFHKQSIAKLIARMKHDKKIGLIGPKCLDENGDTLLSVSGFPKLPGAIIAFSFIDKLFPNNQYSKKYWMRNFNYKKERYVPAVGGACMLYRKSAFEAINGCDARFFMYFEEADIAMRLSLAGYKILYFPDASVTHLVGRSTGDTKTVRRRFEESRYHYFKKYYGVVYGLIAESLVRFLQLSNITLVLVVAISLFLNLYNIQKYMMFYGDFARDLFVARNMLLTGSIPLLGIPSSVVWLHQGPLSIYMMSIALFFGNFNPVAPAILYALLGVGSTILVYLLGRNLFSQRIGLLSAAWYATSPIIILNAREPYHTAPIPFFTLLFFLIFWKVLKGNYKFTLPLFILLGFLLQLELSNVVIVVLLVFLWWFYRLRISTRIILQGLLGFILGIFPFVIYDITHGFIQIGGLALWTLNRIRLFFGITTSGNATTGEAVSAVSTMWSEMVRVIYPLSPTIVAIILVLIGMQVLLKTRQFFNRSTPNAFFIVILWLMIPVLGYTIHAKPGSAYFPVIYPAIILLVANTLYQFARRYWVITAFILIMLFFNAYYVLINNYFLITFSSTFAPALYGYGYGISLEMQNSIVDSIIKDAKGNAFSIQGGGFLKDFATSVDNYKYLVVWKKGRLVEGSKRQYIIYQEPNQRPKGNIVYENKFVFVVKK